ncbi:hypothetical protein LWI28_020532 [Acer negundo]|uniref:Subtilisin-like protease SBT1.6 n=1 Tax=Acer negundo TaxID=4023 RepID=A0AAD5NV68_ACENE|nr:hypothetical protein LWI28_016197 [Acer negundo]KAI9181959.1 hypothetical protein LWI28_020532 [Acer negundo]
MASFLSGSTSIQFLLFLFLSGSLLTIQSLISTDQAVKTYIIRIDSQSKPSIFPTHFHWYTSEFVSSPLQILHTYDTVFHGFSATLSPDRAASLTDNPAVLAVIEDQRRELHTTRSPQFLGLRNQRGLWSESDYGSDVIVGVFDTGIWPERRSFSDLNIGPVPSKWKGVCQTGVKFTAKNCNKKIVGARFFSKGHEAALRAPAPIGGGINETIEFMSPRDADGHGTHTASTAAGRYAFRASMEGYAAGVAKGVAPKSRLAVYKVCWKNSGCFDSDILAAFDAAVNDGVDVISISIGGGDGISSPYYLDPIAIGSYGAASRGVLVSSSAGNGGPNGMSVTNVAPWIVSVGAGTIDRNFPAEVILGDGRRLSGVSLYSGAPLVGKMYPIVYPGKSGILSASLCMENSLDPNLVRGKIVICDRGSSPRVAKGLVVKKAGGVGMVLANGISNGEGLVGDAHLLPACALGSDEGDAIKKYISSGRNPTATIDFKGLVYDITNNDYINFLCGNGYGPKLIQVITRSPVSCPVRKPKPENLNYPSIAALFSTASSEVTSKTIIRTVTNVGQPNAVYRAKIESPPLKGVTMVVKPAKLAFTEAVKKRSYVVTITADTKNLVLDNSGAVFGSISWSDGKHVVRSPIVVTQLDPL